MPWGAKDTSPCVFTPGVADADKISLTPGLVLEDGKLRSIGSFLYFRLKITSSPNAYTALSQIEIFDASGIFTPLGMTTASQNGFVVTHDQYNYGAGFEGFKAFDAFPGSKWLSQTQAVNWVKIQIPANKTPSKYRLYLGGDSPANRPVSWRLEGSNTGAFSGEERVLHSVTNYAWAVVINEMAEFTLRTILYADFLAALAFAPTSPAKLATIGPITPQLEAGSGGSLSLYVMHKNDRLSDWASLADVVGSWSLIGTLTHNAPTDAINFTPGPSEQVIFRLAFDDAGGAPPALLSFSMPWTSDVAAPDAPEISLITPVVPEGGTAGYRADFALPATARHVIVEGRLNGGEWLKFTTKAKMESTGDYMKFRGNLDAVELAGERNETHLSFAKGLVENDVVETRIAAEDDSGNRSSFAASDPVTLEPQTSGAPPVLYVEDAVVAADGTASMVVHLIGVSENTVTVDYASADGTAEAGDDYTAISGTLTFAGDPSDGHRTQTITVNATGTANKPGTTVYSVALSDSSGPTIERATGTVTIINAEIAPMLYIEDAIVFSGQTGKARVHLIGINDAEVTATLTSSDDTAVTPGDYTAIDTTVTFAAAPSGDGHQVVEVDINATGDDPQAGTTAYTLTLSDPVGATLERAEGTVTIRNVAYIPVISDPVEVEISEYDEIEVTVCQQ